MFDAQALEMPFMETLPKREKGKLAKAWDLVQVMREATRVHGPLVPLTLAAKCLNLSRSRIDQVVADGRLQRLTIDDHVFITESSILNFARTERKHGRPIKTPSVGELAKFALNKV